MTSHRKLRSLRQSQPRKSLLIRLEELIRVSPAVEGRDSFLLASLLPVRAVLAGLLFLAAFLLSSGAWAGERWYLEFREAGLPESQVRRAVALELREVTIPGDPSRPNDTADQVSLHIKIARDEGRLTVSLWDRGEFVGRRRVTDSRHSTILARRIGLTVAELGSRLSQKRARKKRVLEREAVLEKENLELEVARKRRQALALRTGITALGIPRGAWALGPSVGLAFNEHYPLSFTTDLSWVTGGLPALADATLGGTAPHWSQFEFLLGAEFLIPAGARTTFSLGGIVGVSTVHVSGAAEVDGIAGQSDTWTARAGLRLGTRRSFGDQVTALIDLSAGALLRPVPIEVSGEELRLGGGFFGLTVTALILPSFDQMD